MSGYKGKVLIEFSIDASSYEEALRKAHACVGRVRDTFSSDQQTVDNCPNGVCMDKYTPTQVSVRRMYAEEGVTS